MLKELEFSELEIADPNTEYSGIQTIFIDFDGATDISYDNDALAIYTNISSINDSGLSVEAQFQILTDLNNTFAGTGISFTASASVNEEYSTIYVGGDGSEFSEYGDFLGLSETIDIGNQIKDDEAFVFSDKISSITDISEIIAHEAAHLIGYTHAGDASIDELSDFAAVATLSDDKTKFTASDGAAYDNFGYSVAVSGSNIVVGAYVDDDTASDSGSVYSYRWNGTSYTEYKINASDADADDWFGISVDSYGDSIVVGSDWGDGAVANSGAAYVYSWNGSSYDELKFTASDGAANDSYGDATAIDNGIVVVGAYADDDDGTNSGSAYVYRWNGSSYDEIKLTASDAVANQLFGYAVAVDGDNVAVGGYGDGVGGTNIGSAYVYRWNGSSYDETKLVLAEGMTCDFFGYAMGMDNDVAVVGAYCDNGLGAFGSAQVYRWNGSSYDAAIELTASDAVASEFFGKSVSISGDYIVVGEHGDNDNGVSAGSVYVYRWDGKNYNEFKLTAQDGSAYDFYGRSVDIDGTIVTVGAYGDDDNGNESGSAYSFDLNDVINHSSSDLNGSGKSDILLTDGSQIGYNDDGFAADYQHLGTYSAGWSIIGIADFENNNKSDILFSDGTQMGYYADGLGSGWTNSGGLNSGWTVKGTADFDGNGTDDILVSDGFQIRYYADGLASGEQHLGTYSAGWSIIETGDFDGNGKGDILFSDGLQMGYYADGLGSGWTNSGGISAGWNVAGTGDFDGNGTDDILVTDGFQIEYYADGLLSGLQHLGTYSAGWEIEGVTNFDGNDKSDILFSETASTQIGYYADGLGSGWTNLGNISSGWDIVLA